MQEDAVRDYLDSVIRMWRRQRDESGSLAEVAPCYIDAFQSARASLLGERLPEMDVRTLHSDADCA